MQQAILPTPSKTTVPHPIVITILDFVVSYCHYWMWVAVLSVESHRVRLFYVARSGGEALDIKCNQRSTLDSLHGLAQSVHSMPAWGVHKVHRSVQPFCATLGWWWWMAWVHGVSHSVQLLHATYFVDILHRFCFDVDVKPLLMLPFSM